ERKDLGFSVSPRSVVTVGTDVRIVLQVDGAPSGLTGYVFFQNELTRQECSERKSFSLQDKQHKKFVQDLTLKVRPETGRIRRNRYIQLVAQSPQLNTPRNLQTLNLRWSTREGYLLIQTDKPIYTPRQKGETASHAPCNRLLCPLRSSGLKTTTHHLYLTMIQFIQVENVYIRCPITEVVQIHVVHDLQLFIYFFYGKGVTGTAYVRFGVMGENKEKVYISGLKYQIKVRYVILFYFALEKVGRPLQDLVGTSLYIAASVIETASGELEEQELTSVKFISSPYSVDLSKTKRYFVPSAPYEVLVCAVFFCSVHHPTWAVWLSEWMHSSMFIKEPDSSICFFPQLTAGTESPAEATLSAKATRSPKGSYLIIESPKSYGLSIGETLRIELKPIGSNAFTDIYYMVLSKGDIISVGSVPRGTLSAVLIPITPNLMPTFRVVAFYRLEDEIVSNSAWLEVVSRCEGKVHRLQPQSRLSLTINTDAKSFVSLSATDAAVYALNGKNRLTQGKVFEAMKSYDLGCTAGSGEDSLGIFADAGLSIRAGGQQTHGCEQNASRKKRSLPFQLEMEKKIAKYHTPDQIKCCKGGIALLRNARSCEERAKRIQNTGCREVFLDCCRHAAKLRRQSWGSHSLARVDDDDDEDFLDDDVITLRRFFPESWLWQTFPVEQILLVFLGICVSEPFKITVFQEFHISLRLPYSVKQFEQIELRPVLYNYQPNPFSVSVYLEPAEGICSPATLGPARKRKVEVPGNSAIPVPFVLVPMGANDIPITIVAVGEWGIGDKVSKKLRVEKEGAVSIEEYTIPLDSKGKSFVHLPTGSVPADTLQSSLDPDGLSSLLRVPHGCAEQTMVLMAPAVYAMHYLDKTEQWLHLKPESKEVALANLRTGYTRILTYRKTNGSYGAWINTPSSTWLTAFVVKILSLTRIYQDVDTAGIQGSVQWILEQQQSDGSFTDSHPVYHREMQGGMGGLRGGVSLTAFVTIALTEALPLYEAKAGEEEEEKRQKQEQLSQLVGGNPCAFPRENVATQSVSQSVSQSVNQAINQKHILKHHFCFGLKFCSLVLVPDSSVLFWLAGDDHRTKVPSAISVEATSYALLYLVKQNDAARASKVAQWLTEQRNYGGGFKSTQDTVVALEALSSYWISTFKEEGNELTVSLTVPGKNLPTQISFGRSNDPVQEELQVLMLTWLKYVPRLTMPNGLCSALILAKICLCFLNAAELEDYYYEYEDDLPPTSPPASQTLSRIELFDARQRRRRETTDTQQSKHDVTYEVCFWSVGLLVSCSSDYSTFPLLDQRCSIFYGAPNKPQYVSALCSDDVCQCAEGKVTWILDQWF
uniref:Anaphylatoxin-like domain-containing protein n=1 Tax=Pseudonaja textilis TaxID=8673 RepID=A0A670ZB43_PSETE